MKFHYADAALFRLGGHPFNLANSFRKELARRGVPFQFYCNRRAIPEVLQRLDGKPVFSFRPRDAIGQDPLTQPLDNLLVKGARLATQLTALQANGLSPNDLVYIPLSYETELFGCALWLERMRPEQQPRLCLYVMNGNIPIAPEGQNPSLTSVLYRYAANRLRKSAQKGRVLLASPIESCAETLSTLTDIPCAAWPLPKADPMEFGNGGESSAARQSGPPTVAILGNSAQPKGFYFLPKIIRLTLSDHFRTKFFIQLLPMKGTGMMDVQTALTRVVTPQHLPRWQAFHQSEMFTQSVELHSGELSDEDYYAKVRESDVHLIAHDPTFYTNRISGIFVEAAKAGRVSVAPAQTWMGEQIRAGEAAGTTFEAWQPDSIADALRRALANLDALTAEAKRLAPKWRARYSTPGLLDGLLAFGRGERA